MRFTEYPTKRPATTLLTTLAIAGTLALFATHAGGVSAGHEADWLKQLAKSGDADAQLQLGLAYRDGRYGLTPDPVTGRYWLGVAAQGGNAYAADAVANSYTSASAGNLQQALPWWQLAAEGGNADAQMHMGRFMRLSGQNEQALAWLREAADRGDRRAHAELAALYHQLPLTQADLHRGENRIAALGERANSSGLKTLFTVWRTVKASSPTTQSPAALMDRASHGDPVAEYQLAVRYRDGNWAVERDPQKALSWLQRSAEAGNPVAVKNLAEIQRSDRASLSSTPHAAFGGSRT